jgi:mono/diheme cytochrome c family protein
MRPPPRDFTLGTFKFAAVPGGTLPHDEDLVRIVRTGLNGTAMLAWDGVPERVLPGIIQYLKTFSPRWTEEEPGEAVELTADPFAGNAAAGVARGLKLYHGVAQCLGCHPAYASKQEIDAASRELAGRGTTDFRADMYGSELKDSDYGVKILPPDFTFAELRSIRPTHRLADLFRVIASGVGGTAMPTWKGSLPDEDIWALAHYVDSLVALKGTRAAEELRRRNQVADTRWTPPAPSPK